MPRPEKGTQYVVLREFKSDDLTPCGPSAWRSDPYVFKVGDIIEFVDTRMGWGSDPALDTIIKGADGFAHRVMSGWGVSPYLDPERGYTEAVG